MSIHSTIGESTRPGFVAGYLDALALIPAVDECAGAQGLHGRELKALGFAKISARPRHYAQNEPVRACSTVKKTSPLLDVIKDEFERVGILEINAVQALLLFNIGENEVTAGELKSRGYYQGSNVSYNLKKLVEAGYMHHQRCEVDRRSVRVRLTEKGRKIRDAVGELFNRHADGLISRNVLSAEAVEDINSSLKRVERYWSDQIRYIY